MNEILYTNIFFIIASTASVIFLIFVCVILFNIIKILQLVRSILQRVDSGSQVLFADLARLRANLSGLGFFGRLLSFFFKKEEKILPVKKTSKKRTSVGKNTTTRGRGKKV